MNSISFFKALLMKEIDEELKGGQKKLDVAEPKGKLTKADFEKLGNMKKEVDTPNPPTDYSGKPSIPGLGPIVDMEEGEDHEVSMAHNSLESIIKSAMELKMKLGNDEKDIPAWIQDHITNAENYINQASKNYHEYTDGEHDMDELPDGTVELPAGDEEDMTLQGMMEELIKAKKAMKEDASDWEEGFEWMDELPKQYGNWKIDIADDSVGFDDQPIVWYYKGDENGYRVVYTPNDYYSTDITLYTPGQDMYDSDTDGITLQSIELGDKLDNFSFEKYAKYGAKAIAKAEQMIQKAGK